MLSEDAYRAAYGRFLSRLRQARLDAGLTQSDVAARLGKPQSFISKVELGERCLDVVELQIVARGYGKTLAHFDDGELRG